MFRLLSFTIPLLLVAARLPADEPWPCRTIDAADKKAGKLGADGVRLADVNGDGLPDLATGWEQGGAIRVCLNPGPGKSRQAWPAVTVGRVGSPEDAVLVDLDGDGRLDVVSSCEGRTRSLFVHWAPGKADRLLDTAAWSTAAIPAAKGKQSWMYALPLNIDGRHGIDLVVGSKGKGGSVGWLASPADPRRLEDWTFHRLLDAGWIMSLEPADVDGDGDTDVVVSDRRGPRRGVFWLEHPGPRAARAGTAWKRHEIGARGVEVLFLALGDLDGDGRQDVLTAARESRLIYLRRKPGPAVAWSEHSIPLPDKFRFGKGVAVADINRDGQPDVVMTNRGDPRKQAVSWMSYRGTPTSDRWTIQRVSDARGVKFDLVQVLDLDADGDLDILTCEEVHNLGVVWYENPLVKRSRPGDRRRK